MGKVIMVTGGTGLVGSAVKEVIDAEIASGKSKPDARTRSPEAIVKEALGKAIAKMQKAESFDLVTMELDDAVKVITKVMNAIR